MIINFKKCHSAQFQDEEGMDRDWGYLILGLRTVDTSDFECFCSFVQLTVNTNLNIKVGFWSTKITINHWRKFSHFNWVNCKSFEMATKKNHFVGCSKSAPNTKYNNCFIVRNDLIFLLLLLLWSSNRAATLNKLFYAHTFCFAMFSCKRDFVYFL